MTIGTGGISPTSVVVSQSSQVTFVNQDSRDHQMASNPHPGHTDCPEINSVGYLLPGESRQTGNLNVPLVCGFHDHLDGTNSLLHGIITIR